MDNNTWNEEVQVEVPKSKAKNIIGLILGILSLPGAIGGFGPIIGIPGWIVSMIMAIVAKALVKKQPDNGLKKGANITATIAIILNIITLALLIIIAVVSVILGFTIGS